MKLIYLMKTIISLFIIFFKINKSSKKIIVFYFNIKTFHRNILKLIKKINDNNNEVLVFYNHKTQLDIKDFKNSFFVDLNLIKFLPFSNAPLDKINFFILSYLSYVYPRNSKNIFISHDIYDAPMVDQEIERKYILAFEKIDYIFSSSEILNNFFKKRFQKYELKKKPNLINTGYLKLDLIYKRVFRKNKKIIEKILIAPVYSKANKKFTLSDKLDEIIDLILKGSNYEVIYRPHPLDLTSQGSVKLLEKITTKYKNNRRFILDTNSDYTKSFINSDVMLTDLSTIAYTYSFSSLKPVLFFNKNFLGLSKQQFFNSYFFKDRKIIGKVIKNPKDIVRYMNKLNLKLTIYKKKIFKLRKKRIKYFGISENRTLYWLRKSIIKY